jgi:hypothetical protein
MQINEALELVDDYKRLASINGGYLETLIDMKAHWTVLSPEYQQAFDAVFNQGHELFYGKEQL